MQLVQARDGTTSQSLADAFEPADQPILEAGLGAARRQDRTAEEPAPQRLARLRSWVNARLGGWTGYYGKPGPLVMRRGLDDFQRIKYAPPSASAMCDR